MAVRDFSQAERDVAESVFGHTLPYERIRVTDQLGFGDRAFTMNAGTGPDASFSLNVGPTGYAGLHQTEELRSLMIHELTHVWQADHSAWTPSFIFQSMFAQMGGTRRAYGYELGEPWSRYNVEQQAGIVQDWFDKGMSESDPRFPYVRDFIRQGRIR